MTRQTRWQATARKPVGAQARALRQYEMQAQLYTRRIEQGHRIGQLRHKLTWFRLPGPKVQMTAGRVTLDGLDIGVGTFAGAKLAAHDAAERWADALLKCPTSSLNHRTARICGKPYHWRQDYTGQLKLAAGESPW